MTGKAAQARFNGRRILGAGVISAIFASYALSGASYSSEFLRDPSWAVMYMIWGVGTLGLLIALPVCLLPVYPVTRLLERRGFTGYRHAALVGATYGAVLAIVFALMMLRAELEYKEQTRTPDVDFLAEIAVPFAVLAGVGALSGLIARSIMGAPRALKSDEL